MAHEDCRIVSPGIVVAQNGTVTVHYIKGPYPLSGSEDVQQAGFPNLAQIPTNVLDLEMSLLDANNHLILALCQWVKDNPTLANLGDAIGRHASVSLTGQSDPISFG